MSTATISNVVGRGAPALALSPEELRVIVAEALDGIASDERVLAIVPDKTRDDNTDLLFPFASEILARKRIAQFDALEDWLGQCRARKHRPHLRPSVES
jgi:hypothetical protein